MNTVEQCIITWCRMIKEDDIDAWDLIELASWAFVDTVAYPRCLWSSNAEAKIRAAWPDLSKAVRTSGRVDLQDMLNAATFYGKLRDWVRVAALMRQIANILQYDLDGTNGPKKT